MCQLAGILDISGFICYVKEGAKPSYPAIDLCYTACCKICAGKSSARRRSPLLDERKNAALSHLFGQQGGKLVWFIALVLTWTLSGLGFRNIYKASQGG